MMNLSIWQRQTSTVMLSCCFIVQLVVDTLTEMVRSLAFTNSTSTVYHKLTQQCVASTDRIADMLMKQCKQCCYIAYSAAPIPEAESANSTGYHVSRQLCT